AWGTTHKEESETNPVPVVAADAPPAKARELAKHCRELGLQPVLMFSGIYPEAPKGLEVLRSRLEQAGRPALAKWSLLAIPRVAIASFGSSASRSWGPSLATTG